MKNRLLGAASLCLTLVAAPALAQDACDCPCPECPETHAEHHKQASAEPAPILSPEEQAAVAARKREASETPVAGSSVGGIAQAAAASAMKAVGAALSQSISAAQSANPTPAEPAA